MKLSRIVNLAAGLLAVGSLIISLEVAAAERELPRLRVSENHRFLITADPKPLFWLGNTAWELFHRMPDRLVSIIP